MVAEWHIVTGEYPPQPGGVSDYTRLVARGLAAAGDVVHIWCPRPQQDSASVNDPGVIVHRELGSMAPRDLLRAGRLINQFAAPRRILVQWVPHAFGFRSANIPLSVWIWNRALRHRDQVEVMVHEPYLALGQERLRHKALAVAHRVMLALLLNAASRVWTAIPKWEESCRPYTFGRSIPFTWLPVVSNITVDADFSRIQAVRSRYSTASGSLIGHFGTCGGAIGVALREVIPAVLRQRDRTVLLIGQDSEQARDVLLRDFPLLQDRIHATGSLPAAEVSSHISACDMMLQPYPDGVSSRRGSLMAALAHGKPVVATSGPLTEPLWHNNDSVVLVPAGNHAEMIAATESLLLDARRRHRLAAAAKIMYHRNFGLSRIVGILRQDVESRRTQDAAVYQRSC